MSTIIRERQYRHELKYHLGFTEYLILRKRLITALQTDPNAGESGKYFIRSLYFDDLSDTSFREKLDGVDSRDKYRVRIYNLSDEIIKLERKHKDGQYICKDSLTLSRDEFMALTRREFSFLYTRPEPFAKSMYIEFQTRMLMPRVIVDYMREPFVFPYEDVRITFDKDIRSAYHCTDMFNKDLVTYPVLDKYDTVLEVKFNRALPQYIRALLQVQNPLKDAVSKYVLCRKFEL